MALRQNSFDLEIETLLNVGQHNHYSDDIIRSVITPETSNDGLFNAKGLVHSNRSSNISDGLHVSPWWIKNGKKRSSDSSSSDISYEEEKLSLEVNGADIGDLPISYTVEGLRSCEFPVIGVYVDKRIITGFKYRIRMLGTNTYLFKGRALTLQSIGMGYGKRITMEGDTLNDNENYFYSDTHERGYGFELITINPNEKFVVFDREEKAVGEASIDSIVSANEISTAVDKKTGEIQKQVRVSFVSSIKYGSDSHGLMPLCSNDSMQLSGFVYISKAKRGKKAKVSAFIDIELKHYGICSFEKGQ